MKQREKRASMRARAIRAALGQLGWHARPIDLVALLANYGVQVNKGLIQRIKVDLLKKTQETRYCLLAARCRQQRKIGPFVKKVPTPRTYHR